MDGLFFEFRIPGRDLRARRALALVTLGVSADLARTEIEQIALPLTMEKGWTTRWPSSNWWIKTTLCEDSKRSDNRGGEVDTTSRSKRDPAQPAAYALRENDAHCFPVSNFSPGLRSLRRPGGARG